MPYSTRSGDEVRRIMAAIGLADAQSGTAADGVAPPDTSPSSGGKQLLHMPHHDVLLAAWQGGVPVVLSGPAGTGKTRAARWVANRFGATLYVQQAHHGLDADELRGSRGLNADGTTFEPGPLVRSLLDPKGCFLLEEINTIEPGCLSIMNNVLDDTGELTIPESGETVKRPENWHFFATMNPNYQGTHPLQEALKSRCLLIDCPVLPRAAERGLLLESFPAFEEHVDLLLDVAETVRNARAEDAHDFDLDFRTLRQFCVVMQVVEDFLLTCHYVLGPKLGAMDDPNRQAVLKVIELQISGGCW